MIDEVQAAPEAAPEVVQPEAEQVEAPEVAKSTEGQVEDQPAEVEGEEPEAEEKSPSKLRRERRKAHETQLRERAQAAEAELAKVKGRLAAYDAQITPPPNQADYQDHNEYLMALAAYQAGQQFDQRQKAEVQREAEAQQSLIEQVQQQQVEAAEENWNAQVVEAKTRYTDFEQVALAPDVPVTEQMAQMMAVSEFGADVAYHLGTNKALAGEIASMPPIEQAMAIGRLEATLQRPAPRTQTQAPEPIAPVKAKATATKNPDNMSMSEYMAARKAGKL